MFLPAFGVVALLWAGLVVDIDALMLIEHVVMLPSMLVAMLLRREEYSGGSHHHAARARGLAGPAVDTAAHEHDHHDLPTSGRELQRGRAQRHAALPHRLRPRRGLGMIIGTALGFSTRARSPSRSRSPSCSATRSRVCRCCAPASRSRCDPDRAGL